MDNPHERLARNLRTAYIANRLGIKLATAERNYAGEDEPPSELWLAVARIVEDGMMQVINENMKVLAPNPAGPVQ